MPVAAAYARRTCRSKSRVRASSTYAAIQPPNPAPACRAAIKAGDSLTRDQLQALLDDLLAAWSPSVCPHGRPVLFSLTVEEMERRFLRR